MKRISGYQTTDGKIFGPEEKQAAKDHQKSLDMEAGLTAIGERIDEGTDLYDDNVGGNAILSGRDFAHFVMKHANDIKAALEGKFGREEAASST